MSQKSNIIFNMCSQSTRKALQLYCKLINDCNSDYYVVLAQKAVCLIRTLQAQGLIKQGNYISNASLDYSNIDFTDKTVTILEDIIVSGSSIATVANKLLSKGVAEDNLRIIAIARDSDYQTIQFTDSSNNQSILTYAMSANDATCIELSYEISQILSYYAMPYETDFPLSKEISVTQKKIQTLTSSPFWSAFDETNDFQRQGNVVTVCVVPNDLMLIKYWNSIGLDLSDNVHTKIRIFINNCDDGSILVRAVPMVFFKEITPNNISFLFENYKDSSNIAFDYKDWSIQTKFNFLQFCLAYKLLESFFAIFTLPIQDEIIDTNALDFVFGNQMALSVLSFFKTACFSDCCKSIKLYYIAPDIMGFNKAEYRQNFDLFDINELLLEPFVYWHQSKELEARNNLKSGPKHYKADINEIKELAYRIRAGFSFDALICIIQDYIDIFDITTAVSLFIDRAIDLGLIVPITYVNSSGYLVRAYRHGEDLPFGPADKYRVVYFLKCFIDQLNRRKTPTDIATISMEKIIVMFFQLGLKKGDIFNRFLGFDNSPILREKFCIHGAVQTVSQNHTKDVYAEHYEDNSYTEWITRWLNNEVNILTLNNFDNRKTYSINVDMVKSYIKNSKLNNLSSRIQNEIDTIGKLLADWYSAYYFHRDEFKTQITILTSCADNFSFASAIMTELHYFKRYWDKQAQEAFSKCLSDEDTSFYYEDTSKALHSGREKTEWYDSNKAIQVIDEVSNKLKRFEYAANIWNDFFTDRYNYDSSQLKPLIEDGICYLYFYSVCYEWLCNNRLLQKNDDSFLINDKVFSYVSFFKKRHNPTRRISKDAFNIFRDIERYGSLRKKIAFLNNEIKNKLECSERIIEETTLQIIDNNNFCAVYYDSCLVIDVYNADKADLISILLEFYDHLDEDEQKTRTNIVYYGTINNIQRVFILFDSNNYEDEKRNLPLIEYYVYLRKLFVKRAYGTNAIYLPKFPEYIHFVQTTKDKVMQQSEQFNEFIMLFERYYKTTSVHSITMLQTHYAPEQATLQFNNLNFEKTEEYEEITIEKTFASIKPTRKYTTNNSSSTTADCSYVSIYSNHNYIGSGTLVIYKNFVYCISCQHVINGRDDDNLYARTKYTNEVIPLRFANKNAFYSPDSYRNAIDELICLIPELPYDYDILSSNLISVDKIDLNYSYTVPFKCFEGSGNNAFGKWIRNISLGGGMIRGGYFELITQPDNHFSPGYSGSGIFDENNVLFGIHTMHNNNQASIIPLKIIKEYLDKNIGGQYGSVQQI